jgi:N-acetylglutamate synthase-like GNAT family acetyltransferase
VNTPAARVIRRLASGEAAECERIMRGLPGWFGIEASLVQYAKDVDLLETWVASEGERVTGFIALRRHNSRSAEIHVIAVDLPCHRTGTGSALMQFAEQLLHAEGLEFLQVKTVGPSLENQEYARTRAFYAKCGFVPLEENRMWGDKNPCLILVKHLSCRPGAPSTGEPRGPAARLTAGTP